MSTFIDLHIIQTLPSSNVNRDDTGRPKTGFLGGFQRARVSSQAWKRATRKDFAAYLPDDLRGVRTLRIVQELVSRLTALEPTMSREEAIERATAVMAAAGVDFKPVRAKKAKAGDDGGPEAEQFPLSEYLLFVSNQQVDRLARLALDADGKPDRAAAKQAINTAHGVEVALFGRMVADDTSLNVDAAVQVAHAIGTHAVTPEYDYYTAVDDKNTDDASAGMIGVVEYNSSTLYRYATVNLSQLGENLGDPDLTLLAAEAFVRSFAMSMPTGKQNTFANGTLPEAVLVQVRDRRPVNLAGAFEVPVVPDGKSSVSTLSAIELARRAAHVDRAYGLTSSPSLALAATPEVAEALGDVAEVVDLDTLLSSLRSAVAGIVGASA